MPSQRLPRDQWVVLTNTRAPDGCHGWDVQQSDRRHQTREGAALFQTSFYGSPMKRGSKSFVPIKVYRGLYHFEIGGY